MKKILITVLAVSLIAVSASGCGGSAESSNATEGTVQLTTAQAQATAASTAASSQETTAAETTAAATKAATTAAQKTTKAESSKAESSAQAATKVITYYTYEEVENSDSGQQSSSASSKSSSSSSAAQASASYSDSDAAIVYKDTTIKIDGAFNASSLGTPDSKQENNNCLTGGTGYTYVYGIVTVNVYTSGNAEYVEGILVDGSDSVSTAKGITYGSSTSDLKKAYGNPSSQDSGMYLYSGSGTSIMFYLSGDSVTGMYISKNA